MISRKDNGNNGRPMEYTPYGHEEVGVLYDGRRFLYLPKNGRSTIVVGFLSDGQDLGKDVIEVNPVKEDIIDGIHTRLDRSKISRLLNSNCSFW